ncbi:MAG: hypothetical protein CME19_06380 [Gemmatimonadetes bacterium]|nr:hypothetical protein [Gemmatimonadota bacterium]
MARPQSDTPLHQQLLDDPVALDAAYDKAAQEFIEVGRLEGHYDGWDESDLAWPGTSPGPYTEETLSQRLKLVRRIEGGIPSRRAERLTEAYQEFRDLESGYHEACRTYLQVKRWFVESGAGTAEDVLSLYQELYLKVIASGQLFSPDTGEEALGRAQVTHVPLSHARAVAEALADVAVSDDPRWDLPVRYGSETIAHETTLKDALQFVAQRTLAYIAAGGLLATRYNTYTNFAWFGCSLWRVLLEVDLVCHHLEAKGKARVVVKRIRSAFPLSKARMIEFVQAHREDPSKLRPEHYWYGSPYSYLTRDMIDEARRAIDLVNRLIRAYLPDREAIHQPEILSPDVSGPFTEYDHVGVYSDPPAKPSRTRRLISWGKRSWTLGRMKKKLDKSSLEGDALYKEAWSASQTWGSASVDVLGVDVDVKIDPEFGATADALGLGSDPSLKTLFLPTHQALLDHPVMFHVLRQPEVLEAMRWDEPQPCVILARTGLARHGVRIGSWSFTMFGMTSERFDDLQEQVDGFVMLDRGESASHTTTALAKALESRPGIIYPMGTTAAFPMQNFPLQNALFSHLPQDIVIIPVAFRGIHSIWPKCPKGNLAIRPGKVEAYFAPPMLGETTLMPRRRSLRVQSEAASLFQAVHISTLYYPNSGESKPPQP